MHLCVYFLPGSHGSAGQGDVQNFFRFFLLQTFAFFCIKIFDHLSVVHQKRCFEIAVIFTVY